VAGHVITFNAGSSSVKFALFSFDAGGIAQRAATGQVAPT
jgi:acetate kinase